MTAGLRHPMAHEKGLLVLALLGYKERFMICLFNKLFHRLSVVKVIDSYSKEEQHLWDLFVVCLSDCQHNFFK